MGASYPPLFSLFPVVYQKKSKGKKAEKKQNGVCDGGEWFWLSSALISAHFLFRNPLNVTWFTATFLLFKFFSF